MAQESRKGIFQELRRRRVFNTAAIYIVGAWVALQVTELALPALNISDFAIRYIWIGVFVLFPLVLFFGWRYDLTGGSIKLTPVADADEGADTSLQRVDHGIIGSLFLMALTVIVMVLESIGQVEPEQLTAPIENSIAVLPFEVCEGHARDRDLAAGLAVEVIKGLAGRGRLKVIARASSLAFADFGLPVQQIARSLGVQYLLTGEVCREDGNLTLSAELFTEQGFIEWSDHFIQEVNQWEQITERLATMVATGVAAKLGDAVPVLPDRPVNLHAYEQLLIGREHLARSDSEKARSAFERALEYQPDQAEALFEIALMEIRESSYLEQGTAMKNARQIAERALTMAKRQLESGTATANTHYIVGSIMLTLASMEKELAWRDSASLGDEEIDARKTAINARYRESERHFRTAINLNSSLIDAHYLLSRAIEKQGSGRDAESLKILEQAQGIDPFNLYLNLRIAKRWVAHGQYRQAMELLDRFKKLPEIPALVWGWQLELMKLNGYLDERCETLIDMLLHHPDAFSEEVFNRWQAWWFVSDLAEFGLLKEAEAWKERIENIPLADSMRETGLNHYLEASGKSDVLYEETRLRLESMSNEEILDADNEQVEVWAWILADAGQYKRAIDLLESLQYAPATWAERETSAVLGLADLYQKAGRGDESEPLLKKAVASLEAKVASGIRHPQTLSELALAYQLQGRDDEALDMLRKAVDYHYIENYKLSDCSMGAIGHGLLASFPDDPRKVVLCERMAADWQQQANRVRSMLSVHDIDVLLAPLMALAAESDG